jgi:hypothetical protein
VTLDLFSSQSGNLGPFFPPKKKPLYLPHLPFFPLTMLWKLSQKNKIAWHHVVSLVISIWEIHISQWNHNNGCKCDLCKIWNWIELNLLKPFSICEFQNATFSGIALANLFRVETWNIDVISYLWGNYVKGWRVGTFSFDPSHWCQWKEGPLQVSAHFYYLDTREW